MERHILHVNIASFFIAAARAVQPRLLSYPVAIATPGGARSLLLDISQEARQAGLWKGMLLPAAKRRCPELVVLDPCPELYARAQAAVLQEIDRLSPRVEPAGPGHFFIDLTGTARLWGIAIDQADRLRKVIKDTLRLDSALGLARNKLVSKIATRVVRPVGLCEVMAGGEADFMAPLPLHYLPGLDHKLAAMLLQLNLRAIGDLVAFPADALSEAFGQKALEIRALARGIDHTPVRERTAPEPSIREEYVLERQTNEDRVIEAALFRIVSHGGLKLRKMGLGATRLELSVRYADGVVRQRTVQVDMPLCGDLSLYESFLHLLRTVYTRRVRLARLSISLLRLSFPYGQLDLFGKITRERNLMKALDALRTKFGPDIITFWGRQASVAQKP
ncbi:MAG: DNA polymerase Y family protein [bacterium]